MLPLPGPRVPEGLMRPGRRASWRRPQKFCIISPYTVATGIFAKNLEQTSQLVHQNTTEKTFHSRRKIGIVLLACGTMMTACQAAERNGSRLSFVENDCHMIGIAYYPGHLVHTTATSTDCASAAQDGQEEKTLLW